MNRRDALKKLAAGGALAAGGSMVLSSREVAYAASGPGGLTGLPECGEPLPITVAQAGSGFTVTDVSAPSCAGDDLTTNYSWRFISYSLLGIGASGSRLRLETASGTEQEPPPGASCPVECTGYTPPNPADSSIAVNRQYLLFGFFPFDVAFQNGDQVTLGLQVSWSCGGNQAVTAEYVISGTVGGAAPTVTQLSRSDCT